MPELPEVETIVRQLNRVLKGRRVLDFECSWSKLINALSVKQFKQRIRGKVIQKVERRGKFILIYLDGEILIIHLKLTGRLMVRKQGVKDDKYQIAKCILDKNLELHYADVRKFGRFWLIKQNQLNNFKELQKLGPDALKISFSDFFSLLKSKKGKIKTVLMDQANLSGIGNIYADESLFAAKIHPLTRANQISQAKAKILYQKIRTVLQKSIQRRGTSDQWYLDSRGEKGENQNYLKVYGRQGEKCPVCGSKIEYIKINQRGTHFCPRCQKLK